MVKHLLFLCLILLSTHLLTAQAPPLCPSDNTPAADLCPDACIHCNLDQYTGTTSGYSGQTPSAFCGTIENEQWLAFVAGASAATISATPSNCETGNGIQVALYTACSSDPVFGGCDGGFAGGADYPATITVNLTPGAIYYLMVDGYAGDQCDFSLTVTPPGAAIGVQFETEEYQFCPGDTVVIDGIPYTEPGNYTDTIPSITSACDTIRGYILSYLPQPTLLRYILLQPGEPVVIGGDTYFAPDTAQTLLPATVGCDTLATYVLLLDQSIADSCTQSQSFLKLFGEVTASERGEVLCPAADGNFYVAGGKDIESLLMKVTPNGDVLWSRTFQPVPSLVTHITDLVEDSDGMLVGCAIAGDGVTDLQSYAFRYNPLTNSFIWSKIIDLESPEAFAVLEKNPGGNFLLLTSLQTTINVNDAEIWELNRNTGVLVGALADRYNFGISDVWNSMVIHDGALYVIGRHIPTFQFTPVPLDKMRMGLSRLNLTTGAPVWSRLSHVDTNLPATLFGQDLIVHDDALVSVYNGNDSGDPDASPAFFLQKNALNGDLLWAKRFDTPMQAGVLSSDIQQMSDGYVIIGLSLSNAIWNKIIVKTDFNGEVQWAKRITNTNVGATADALNLGQHQAAVINEVLYLATSTASFPTDAVFLKMNSDGEVSDSCGYIEPFDIQSQAIINPTSTPIQVPLTQIFNFSINNPVTTQPAAMPASTFCIRCCEPVRLEETFGFCPGESVTIDSIEYTQSATVIDTIPGATACEDTIITYIITLLPFNVRSEAIDFCPGESVTIDGVVYTQSGTVVDTIPANTGCDTIVTYTLTLLPYNTNAQAISFCPGESVTIDGVEYTQSGTVTDTIPGTVGCDTIVTYTLTLLPYNFNAATITFCPGESVIIGGVEYTQSGTVVDTILATTGCDTIVTYTLILLPQPTRSETVEFCSGESVVIDGVVYTQPGTVVVTLPAAVGCDTVVTYSLQFTDTPNSSVSIDCPANIDIAVAPGTGPIVVNYNLPTVSGDCECPGIALALTQGFASGSLFPISETTVCYQAKDSCGNTATCCFEVSVHEESPCDVKTIGCMKYELLAITRGSSSLNLTYQIRVTNNCSNKMIYTAIQIPDGLVATEPANNSVFTAGSGRKYDVRNPNYSPFYSVRFKSQSDSIANGQSDIFEYTLPPQINPAYIHVTSRLYPQIFQEAHLNTFNCPIEIVQDKPANRQNSVIKNRSDLKIFPNPTSGTLFADLSDWHGEQLQIQVFNSQGQRVQLLTVQAGDMPQQVELPEGLSAGLYFLEVWRHNGEKQAVRFVVQR